MRCAKLLRSFQGIFAQGFTQVFLFQQHLYCLGDRVAAFTPHWAGFSDFFAADVTLK